MSETASAADAGRAAAIDERADTALLHRLRNKLSIVIGSADILVLTSILPADALDDLARIRRASVEALDIVSALEAVDRPE